MSISIDNIYCKHWLVNDILKGHINDAKYPIGIYSIHHCLHIFDTIHYNAIINNNFDLYNNLIINTNQSEHSEEIYKNLIINFDINKMNKINLIYDEKLDKYIGTENIYKTH